MAVTFFELYFTGDVIKGVKRQLMLNIVHRGREGGKTFIIYAHSLSLFFFYIFLNATGLLGNLITGHAAMKSGLINMNINIFNMKKMSQIGDLPNYGTLNHAALCIIQQNEQDRHSNNLWLKLLYVGSLCVAL